MEKIKRLAPWDIFDLWETDAGKMGFADTWDRDTLRFTVHFHDDSSGNDSDIFPGVGATPGMFEVISHG